MKKKFLAIIPTAAAVAIVFCFSGASVEAKTRVTPRVITKNKYGFLSGGSEEDKLIKKYGARWVRPHPGPFLWNEIQPSEGAAYNFAPTDATVRKYTKRKTGILATLWPFADWDQLKKADPDKCRVSDNDEFLPGAGSEKGRAEYISRYRCNPNNWDAYANWVKAVVERYDGDGRSDMKKLKYKIKYWEVMNEPDLDGSETLDFYKDGAPEYAELLKRTYQAIKEADPSAEVLIAGAAGGDSSFLDFYRDVFSDPDTLTSFDVANVHCISNDSYDSLNVEPYKNMLAEFGLTQPIWVTEAETIISDDAETNASQTLASVRSARNLGAQRIFFTRYSFEGGMKTKDIKKNYKRITGI